MVATATPLELLNWERKLRRHAEFINRNLLDICPEMMDIAVMMNEMANEVNGRVKSK